MTLLAQHGWGKSTKIATAMHKGSIGGVIVSPRDETPEGAASLITSIASAHPDSVRLFDPLFQVGMVTPAKDGKLPDYEYYRSNMSQRDFIGTASSPLKNRLQT